MILANYAQQNRNAVREWGVGFTNPLAGFRPGMFQSFSVPDGATPGRSLAAFNHGYNTEYAWALPMKTGGMGSTGQIVGSGNVTNATAWAVKLAQASLTGSGELTAVGGLIVQLVAAVTGNGAVSSADMKAFLQLAAALSGSGVAAGPATGLGALLAALTGSGTANGSTLTGAGALSADLVVTGTGLSTANVGQAVWSAMAAANNTAGTMGEKLNDAGSGSNPWTEVIEAGYSAADVLRLISAVLLGNATGLESGAQAFTGLDGTTERVTGTYTDGERTTTGLDPAA